VLPHGISSGSEKFQKGMIRILEGLKGVECNIDDVLVHASTRELHDYRLEKMLERLPNAGVTLNIQKCTFRVPKIKFLGNVVSANGIEVDPEIVAAVININSTQECPRSLCILRDGQPPGQIRRTFSRLDQTHPRSYAEGPPVGLGTTPTKSI